MTAADSELNSINSSSLSLSEWREGNGIMEKVEMRGEGARFPLNQVWKFREGVRGDEGSRDSKPGL